MIKTLGFFAILSGSLALYMLEVHNSQSSYTPAQVIYSVIVSFVALILAIKLIPVVAPKCLGRGLFGRDINKDGDSKIPESLGIVSGIICLIAIICNQWSFQSQLAEYNAALISMCLMLLLGFCDDVLDVRWRDKLLLSFVACIPLLVGYSGETTIVIPKPLRPLLGSSIWNLGYLYHVYMANTVVFCTNSINIYAGINGLETGQSLVMAAFVILHNLLHLGTEEESQHLLSLFIMLPFFASTLGLFYYNRYPSRAFVGDSFTYFAGMSFAVCGILGHFSKTLMIIFIPQLINFILSLPQLFNIIPCPRHRLPKLDPHTGKLNPTPNLTLINYWLRIFGPQTEKALCIQLLAFQVACCSVSLFLSYQLVVYYY